MADDEKVIYDEKGHPRHFSFAPGETGLSGASAQDTAKNFLKSHADLMKVLEKCGVPADHILFLKNQEATRKNIAQKFTPFLKRIRALADTADLEADLTALAADYLRAVLQEPVVQLRRLVVGEANRVPELAQLYYDQAPARTLAAFAECFSVLHDRGLLRVPEPADAAEHFAFLVVGRCIDQALFCGGPDVLASVDVGSHVRAGVRVFLAAYQIHTR